MATGATVAANGLFRPFGLRGRRRLKGGTYGEMDLTNALESTNPIQHWTQAYLRFTLSQGGARIREVMGGVMSTTGLVAALISTLVVSALVSPPLCQYSNSGSCQQTTGMFSAYGAILIVNLISCVTCITYATIGSLWLGVHRDEEMSYFIVEYYVFAVAIPATSMSFAIVGTIAAELLRVWVIYGEVAFYIGIGMAFVVMVPCCWFATKIVFTTVELRRAHMETLMQGKRVGSSHIADTALM